MTNDMFQLQFTFFDPLIWQIVVRERTRIVIRLRKKFILAWKKFHAHIQQNVSDKTAIQLFRILQSQTSSGDLFAWC